MGLLKVLMKWRTVPGLGERLCVNVRGEYSVLVRSVVGKFEEGSEDAEEGETHSTEVDLAKLSGVSGRMQRMVMDFGMATKTKCTR